MQIRPISDEDVMFWPDGIWCYREELCQMSHKSDDFEVIPYGTPRYWDIVNG
jgi:hypothetical protein